MAQILIIDDDAASVGVLVRALHHSGAHQVRVASSAADALRIALQFRPALTFLDIELPDMGGYELALLLHQHRQLQQMRLVALTDSGEHPGREHARASGFERYIVKPVTHAAVIEALELLL